MHTWLLYPPFADPTQPYLSLPYLKGCLQADGLDAHVVDLNIEAAHYLLGRDHWRRCSKRIAERFVRLNARKQLSPLARMEYLTLVEARPAARRLLAAKVLPAEILQDPVRFYAAGSYRQARDLAEDALLCTSAAAFPFRYHFNQAAHIAVPWGTGLLARYFRERQSPLDGFYRDRLCPGSHGSIRPGDVVGISLTFISQLPEAFYLAQFLRREIPGLFIVLGGSCLQQILQHAGQAAREWILSAVDAVCAFEGEACLPALLRVLNDGPFSGERPVEGAQLAQVPNLLFKSPQDGRIQAGPRHVTDLKALGPPDYTDLDLDRYLAPERMLLFAPTRGCYWNRCTFCDYGLNRAGDHGYREMAAEEAARQLGALSRQHAVTHFYISVDVMAPRFAEALGRALLAQNVDIRWSADFRIESYFTDQRCALLFQSGLRAAAFGVESGCDRVLKLMDKGNTAQTMRTVSARFHQAGIATAWMTFSDHPGEDEQAVLETVRLIDQSQSFVDLFILGRFGLTSGSEIAAQPQRFGIRQVYYCRGDDLRLFPLFEAQQLLTDAAQRRTEEEVARLSRLFYLDHYPWAGAISTHHTFLYFLKYGPRIFRKLQVQPPKGRNKALKANPAMAGLAVAAAFPLARLQNEQQRFMRDFWREALAPVDGGARLDEAFFSQAAAQARPRPKKTKH